MRRVSVRRARLLIAYDGSAFHGFAPNDGVETVAGTLNRAIGRVVRGEVELTGAGRTDAGVHGWGQVVSVDLPDATDLSGLQRRVNSMCAPHVVVRSIEWTDDDFNARFSATWRHYRYTIVNSPVPDPFRTATAWHVHEPLHVDLMRLGCDPLIGEHDFASFCRRPKVRAGDPEPTLVRRVISARWSSPEPDLLVFEIRANAFCHQMVRSIVGTLVDVGRGRLHAGDLSAILRAHDRAAAGTVAPPHGLCLWAVGYADSVRSSRRDAGRPPTV